MAIYFKMVVLIGSCQTFTWEYLFHHSHPFEIGCFMDSPGIFLLGTWRMNLVWNRGKLPGIPRDIVQCQPFCLLICLNCLRCLHAAVIIFLRFRILKCTSVSFWKSCCDSCVYRIPPFLRNSKEVKNRKSTVSVPMVTHLQPKPQGFCDAPPPWRIRNQLWWLVDSESFRGWFQMGH